MRQASLFASLIKKDKGTDKCRFIDSRRAKVFRVSVNTLSSLSGGVDATRSADEGQLTTCQGSGEPGGRCGS